MAKSASEAYRGRQVKDGAEFQQEGLRQRWAQALAEGKFQKSVGHFDRRTDVETNAFSMHFIFKFMSIFLKWPMWEVTKRFQRTQDDE